MNDVIIDVTEKSFPVLKALRADQLVPFTERVGDLVLSLPRAELSMTIATGVDMFNSVPDEKMGAFNAVVKEEFANLKTDSCTLIPLPSATTANAFVTFASTNVDSAKLSDFRSKWGPALGSLPTTGSAICLPPVESLDRLALAQAEIGRSFGRVESRQLSKYINPKDGLLTQSAALAIPVPDALSLLADAKRLTAATGPEKTAFRFAGMKVESVVKRDATLETLAATRRAK